MKKFLPLAVTITAIIATANISHSQNIAPSTTPIIGHGVINFKQVADKELINPPKSHPPRDLEIEKKKDLKEIIHDFPVTKDAKVTMINGNFTTTIDDVSSFVQPSPQPNKVFNGIIDNNQVIPPDVMGAAGPHHLFETLNSQYRIFHKSGETISTLSLDGFWSGLQSIGFPYSDPHLVYDANTNRWFTCIVGILFTNHFAIFVAVSETSDPTGNWYEYALDTGPTTILPDYPLLGYNKKWIVITTNDFKYNFNSGFYVFKRSRIMVINKVQLMSDRLRSVNAFFDPELYTISPAETMDANEEKEYLLTDYNGNFQGNGYLKMGTITGTGNDPVYKPGVFIGVNRPWNNFSIDVPQKGSKELIDAGETKMRSVIVRNGFVWATHTVFLPATSTANRASSDWWQINPATQTVAQYGRLDDASCRYDFSWSSIAVTPTNDLLLGASAFSKKIYASAIYAYRASSDAANTIRKPITFRNGKAPYFKTYGGDRNRWGDYSATCIDPANGTFWTLQEFAYFPGGGYDRWGTVWANVTPAEPIANATTSSDAIVSNDNNVTISPNPSKGNFILNYLAKRAGNATITVYSLNGSAVYNQATLMKEGWNQFNISLQNIAHGNYIVTVQNNGEAKKEKLIVVQ